jgi:hypothetical protein
VRRVIGEDAVQVSGAGHGGGRRVSGTYAALPHGVSPGAACSRERRP